MAFDIEKYDLREIVDEGNGAYSLNARKPTRNDAIALAKHFGLFDGYKEICERFESKQSLHKDDCFAYQVASKYLKELTNEQN